MHHSSGSASAFVRLSGDAEGFQYVHSLPTGNPITLKLVRAWVMIADMHRSLGLGAFRRAAKISSVSYIDPVAAHEIQPVDLA